MYLQSPPNHDNQWVTMDDVSSGVVINGLENGQLYQVRLKAYTYNTELELELLSDAQILYAKPLSTATSQKMLLLLKWMVHLELVGMNQKLIMVQLYQLINYT